jgi:hypothetical protein
MYLPTSHQPAPSTLALPNAAPLPLLTFSAALPSVAEGGPSRRGSTPRGDLVLCASLASLPRLQPPTSNLSPTSLQPRPSLCPTPTPSDLLCCSASLASHLACLPVSCRPVVRTSSVPSLCLSLPRPLSPETAAPSLRPTSKTSDLNLCTFQPPTSLHPQPSPCRTLPHSLC